MDFDPSDILSFVSNGMIYQVPKRGLMHSNIKRDMVQKAKIVPMTHQGQGQVTRSNFFKDMKEHISVIYMCEHIDTVPVNLTTNCSYTKFLKLSCDLGH